MLRPGEKLSLNAASQLVGALVVKDGDFYLVVPGALTMSNPRLMTDDEARTIVHVGTNQWSQYTIVRLPPTCPRDLFDVALERAERLVEALSVREQVARLEELVG